MELGLFSSIRAICQTDGMNGWMGWLSLVVGSLRAPMVLMIKDKSGQTYENTKRQKDNTHYTGLGRIPSEVQ